MKYFVKYLRKNKYTLSNKLTIKSGEEVEVEKEVFDYLNGTFGDAGMFTFRKEDVKEPKPEAKPTKSKRKVKEDEVAEEAKEVEIAEEVVEASEK